MDDMIEYMKTSLSIAEDALKHLPKDNSIYQFYRGQMEISKMFLMQYDPEYFKDN